MDCRDELFRALFGEALERHERLDGERIQVGHVVHQPRRDELRDALVLHAADVHRAAGCEVHEPFELASRARDVGAVHRDFLFVAKHGCIAAGAALRHVPFALAAITLLGERGEDLRDDVTRALHLNEVADAQILLVDELLVVQRRELHCRAANLHGLEHRVWVERARAADVHLDGEQTCDRDVRRELPGDCPPRLASADDAELLLHAKRVDLHDDAIDAEVELRAKGVLHLVYELRDILERRAMSAVRLDRESPALERVEQLALGGEGKRDIVGGSGGEAEEAQRALRGHGGIELAQRARGGVARVREDRLAGLRALFVQPLERIEWQIALAADLDEARRFRVVEAEGDVAHRAQIWRDDLADRSVPARRASDEHSVFVGETDCGAVDLELCTVTARRIVAHLARDARLPFAQLVVVKGVPQRDHGDEVRLLGELSLRSGADALRGRVERTELRVLFLELLELAVHAIVVEIGDLGTVEHVVLVGCALERTTQLRGARGECCEARGHRGKVR